MSLTKASIQKNGVFFLLYIRDVGLFVIFLCRIATALQLYLRTNKQGRNFSLVTHCCSRGFDLSRVHAFEKGAFFNGALGWVFMVVCMHVVSQNIPRMWEAGVGFPG